MDANEEGSLSDSKDTKRDKISKDKWSIALLLLLYTLQGIPLGLAASIPMVLQAKKVGYRQQALFSLVSWPFSVKLLWAPLVDSFYSRSFGRRKSWLIPTQYVIGLVMLVLSYYMNDLLGSDNEPPRVMILTVVFFVLFVCAATQDIAVDGWALTILSRENVGHASTCNSVGQTVGYFLGYTIFLALESKEFCNAYLRWGEPQDKGLVDLPEFLFFWGLVFVIVTTLVWLLKKETREPHTEIKEDILSAYGQLLNMLKLKSVQTYVVFALTSKV